VDNEFERMWKVPVVFYFERLSRDSLEILSTEQRRTTESFRIIIFGLGIEARNFASHSETKSKETARDSMVQCELGCLN
jgi:hypothetical protein